MNIKILEPIGYCYGVTKAINEVKDIKKKYFNKNIFIFGLLIHNEEIINYMNKLGVTTIDITKINIIKRLHEFTLYDVVIFTAHGHPKFYEDILKENNVTFFSTTCPNVDKNYKLIQESLNNKSEVIFIGDKNHAESITALSLSSTNIYLYDLKDKLDYSRIKSTNPTIFSQTTLSKYELMNIDKDIKEHFPNARFVDEVCDVARLRQDNILNIKDDFDLLIIIGSHSSSNTNKLYDLAKAKYKDKMILFINSKNELKEYDLKDIKNIVITSGTSTSLLDINKIVDYLKTIK